MPEPTKAEQQKKTPWKFKLPRINPTLGVCLLILLATVWLTYRIDTRSDFVVRQLKAPVQSTVAPAKPPQRNR